MGRPSALEAPTASSFEQLSVTKISWTRSLGIRSYARGSIWAQLYVMMIAAIFRDIGRYYIKCRLDTFYERERFVVTEQCVISKRNLVRGHRERLQRE